MNIILFGNEDFIDKDRVRITDRRYRHVRDVLRAGKGDALTAGVIGGRRGRGRIVHADGSSLEMDLTLDRDPPQPLSVNVILALPRPKVLRRVLVALAVLGVKHVALVNAVRVEKSYWQSPFLAQEEVRRMLLLGLEQAGDTILPEVHLRPRFRPYVEDELPAAVKGTLGLVAHPAAEAACPRNVRQPVTLAIGPDGGFVPFEIELLAKHGLAPVNMGPRTMNVETAVPSLLARLA